MMRTADCAAVAGAGEAGEIVLAFEISRGGLHGGDVQGLPAVPALIGEEGVSIQGGPDEILVALAHGGGDGVEGIGDGLN